MDLYLFIGSDESVLSYKAYRIYREERRGDTDGESKNFGLRLIIAPQA